MLKSSDIIKLGGLVSWGVEEEENGGKRYAT